MAELQVPHLGDRPVSEMSSGEAKRVLIARALVHRPRALLFDEPSNSLDLFARRSLRQTMSLLANSGIGTILVTHDLADIIPEIERVVLMSERTHRGGWAQAGDSRARALVAGVRAGSGNGAARRVLPFVVSPLRAIRNLPSPGSGKRIQAR